MASTLTTARAGTGFAAAFPALCVGAAAMGVSPVFSPLVIVLEAVAAALFAWALLGEALSPIQAAGGVLIPGGIRTACPKEAAPEGRSPS